GIADRLHGRCAVSRMDHDARCAQEAGLSNRSAGSWCAIPGQDAHHGVPGLSVRPDETGRDPSQAGTVGRGGGSTRGPDSLQEGLPPDPGTGRGSSRRPPAVRVDGRTGQMIKWKSREVEKWKSERNLLFHFFTFPPFHFFKPAVCPR